MSPRQLPAYDAITTPSEEIVRTYRALIESDEDDASLALVHYRGGQAEYELGRLYAQSSDAWDRVTGAHVLSQLGWGDDSFHDESVELLLALLTDNNADVVAAAAGALGHRKSQRAIPFILPLINRAETCVRRAAVSGLTGLDDSGAIAGLIRLSRDSDDDIRNWAAFGFGTISDADTPEIRDALAALLDEEDAEIRGEALIGLSKRQDARALPALIKEFNGPFYGAWRLEAAELLHEPELLPLLKRLRQQASAKDAAAFASDFEWAINACTPN